MTIKQRITLSAAIAGLLLLLFHFHGNSADVHMFGKSIFVWAPMRWNDFNGALTYSYFVPLITAALIFLKRKDLVEANKFTDPKAMIVIIGALFLHLIGLRAFLPRLSLLALIILIWSIPWYLAGREVARLLLFPCSYLLFCIPLSFLDSVTFPMRLFAAKVSTGILNGLGIEVKRIGTGIHAISENGFRLDVADPCSGLRYFLVLMVLSALFANLSQKTNGKKWLLFLCAPIIAIAANIIRIIVIAIAAQLVGVEAATGLYHDFSGYIVFISAVILLMCTSKLINMNIKQVLTTWKKHHTNSISE